MGEPNSSPNRLIASRSQKAVEGLTWENAQGAQELPGPVYSSLGGKDRALRRCNLSSRGGATGAAHLAPPRVGGPLGSGKEVVPMSPDLAKVVLEVVRVGFLLVALIVIGLRVS
jgi:hypothetical protein